MITKDFFQQNLFRRYLIHENIFKAAFQSFISWTYFERGIYLCSTHKYLMDTMHKRKNYMYGILQDCTTNLAGTIIVCKIV